MEWHHQSSSRKKKFKIQTSAVKVMATVFWDSPGILLSSGILGGRDHSQVRVMCADIQEVKTTDSKGSNQQDDESSPPAK